MLIVFQSYKLPFDKSRFERVNKKGADSGKPSGNEVDSLSNSQTEKTPPNQETDEKKDEKNTENPPKTDEEKLSTNQPNSTEETVDTGQNIPNEKPKTDEKPTPQTEKKPENADLAGDEEYSYYDPNQLNYFFMTMVLYDDKYSDRHNLTIMLPMYMHTKVTPISAFLTG